ncbi:MAG TPA: hypothetical protein VHZ31_03535 [Solirubrobacteraceae bacterium]|jgi:hypothetical protein|nr:hypothetical protein [Solirubrobacteraceae bacterium]
MQQIAQQSQWTAPVIVNMLLAALAIVLAWTTLHQHSTLTDTDHEALQHDIRSAIESVQPPTPATTTTSLGPRGVTPSQPPTPSHDAVARRKKRPGKTVGKHKRRRRR